MDHYFSSSLSSFWSDGGVVARRASPIFMHDWFSSSIAYLTSYTSSVPSSITFLRATMLFSMSVMTVGLTCNKHGGKTLPQLGKQNVVQLW